MTNRHPRADESVARRAQLERLKVERRARREAAPPRRGRRREGSGASFAPLPTSEPAGVTLPQLTAELQRLAMGGVMPSPAVFDQARPAVWPTAEQFCAQFGATWTQLAREAGLRLGRGLMP